MEAHAGRPRRAHATVAIVSAVVALALLGAALYALMNARSVQLLGDIVHRVDTDERVVALTFDDGPTPQAGEVLEVLDALDARGTFFVTGKELAAHPDLGRQLVAAGHELGNHSWSHERMLLMSRARIAEEIERTDAQIRAAGHVGPIHFRPPYGKKLLGLPRYLADHDRLTVMVDVEPDSDPDLARDAEAMADHVLATVAPGSIVLLHLMYEVNDPARQALPEIIRRLRAADYELVTVSELLEHRD